MNWITAKYLPLDQDLSRLTQFLTARGLIYRVSEESGQQVLSVQDPQLVEPLARLVDEFIRGEVELPSSAQDEMINEKKSSGVPLWMTPVTLGLIVLSACGALLIETEAGQQWALWFTFLAADSDYRGFLSFSESLARSEYWRLLTPAFIHFSFFHFLFNSLWMWDFGRRLELALGKVNYTLFFIITAVAANLVQYFWSGSSLFGGMSGVVYALVGFVWLRNKLAPHPLLAVPPGIIGFMLFWLVFCMTGIVDQFIDGSVANAAHLGGLVAGIILGIISGLRARSNN